MSNKNFISNIVKIIILIMFTLIPFYNIIVNGIYNWHVRQPQFIEGGIEVIIYIVLSILSGMVISNKLVYAVFILGATYLSMNGVILPFIVSCIYFESICYIGMKFSHKEKGILKNFLAGTSIWGVFAIVSSLFGKGRIVDLILMTIILVAISFKLKTEDKYISTVSIVISKVKRISSIKNERVLFIIIVFFLLSLIAKTNTALDYDSLWYGLRPEHVLIGENSFYDNLGYSAFVYYYPKLMELFYLPISGFGDYSFIITANIYILILLILNFHKVLTCIFNKNNSEIFRLLIIAVVFSIPAIANISVTAKPDILGAFFTFSSFSFITMYLVDNDIENIFYALISMVLLTGTKQTYLLWGGIIFLISLISIIRCRLLKETFYKLFSYSIEKISRIIVLLSSIFFVTGIHYRTFKITGYPLYPVLIDFFNRLGFDANYPFKDFGLATVTPQIASKEIFFERLYQFVFNPNSLSHVIMLWTSSFTFFLIIYCIILIIQNYGSIKSTEKNCLDFYFKTCFLFLGSITIYYMTSMEQPDGNYFIIPIILISLIILYWIYEKNEIFTNNKFNMIIFVSFLLMNLPIAFVSHPSWEIGTKGFTNSVFVTNFESEIRNLNILDYNGIGKIAERLKYEFHDKRILSSYLDYTILGRMDAKLETFWEVESAHLSNEKTVSDYESFCKYVEYANIKGFLITNNDSTIFNDFVYKYINDNGYQYVILDEKAKFYCV